MEATGLLTADHRAVETLFKRFELTGNKAHKARRKIVDEIIQALSVHAVIEEQLFYPAVRACSPKLNDLGLEALEEHHVAKWTLSELENLPPQDERFSAKVKVLIESIRHHVKEEEKELFPKARKALSAQKLQDLGEALEKARALAPTHPHPRSPDEPPGNVVAGAFAKVLDSGRDMVKTVARKGLSAARTARHPRRRTTA